MPLHLSSLGEGKIGGAAFASALASFAPSFRGVAHKPSAPPDAKQLLRNAEPTSWMERQSTVNRFLSGVAIGAIGRGIARQCTGSLDQALTLCGEQILSFDLNAVRRWGQLGAALGSNGAVLIMASPQWGMIFLSSLAMQRIWRRQMSWL